MARECTTKHALEQGLQEDRDLPRQWYKRHHVSAGVGNEFCRPEQREYFDVPFRGDVDIDKYMDEFLHSLKGGPNIQDARPDCDGPPRWLCESPAHQAASRKTRPLSAVSGASVSNPAFSWRLPEEEAIANALQLLERESVAKTENSGARGVTVGALDGSIHISDRSILSAPLPQGSTMTAPSRPSRPPSAGAARRTQDDVAYVPRSAVCQSFSESLDSCWAQRQRGGQQQRGGQRGQSRAGSRRQQLDGNGRRRSASVASLGGDRVPRTRTPYGRHAAAIRDSKAAFHQAVFQPEGGCRPTATRVPTTTSDLRQCA